jgi:ATP-dependent exoDNAse (exonuclease V) beta subunit
MTSQSAFPHLVIRASAGTGKTWQLAVRFIGLLAAGVRPDEILATTFTRKAAGEILDRVLFWLASAVADSGERTKLSDALGQKSLSREKCRELLIATVRRLHTLRIGTLDSYFLQVATSFGHELGLPPGWSICEDLTDQLLRDEAIELALTHGRLTDLLTLVHSLTKGEASRSIARLIHDTVGSLFELYRETTPAAWQQIKVCAGLKDDELEQSLTEFATLAVAEKRMATARDKDLECCRAAAWEELIEKGLAAKVLSGECAYYKKPLPGDLVTAYKRLLRHAESILVGQVARQTEATRELLERFAEHYTLLQLEERAMRFRGLTFRLGRAATAIAPESLAFRLDGHIRHLLLDEFQDTSPAQWRILRPLAQSITSRGGGSFFCVGDQKQAIYGWRGGVAEVFNALPEELTGLTSEELAKSYRSAQPIIDAVNAVFTQLMNHPNLDKLAGPVEQWQSQFPTHQTARTELAGYVTLATAPPPAEGREPQDALFEHAAQLVKRTIDEAPRASVGVLVRTNTAVAKLIYRLRQLGIPASEEGGNPLIDSPAVELLLSLLKIADHPGDRVAGFHVATSPLAPQLAEVLCRRGAENSKNAAPFDYDDAAVAARLSQCLRRQLLDDGYGATIHAWSQALAPACDERDLSRLQQLVELAFDYQPASTLRTDHFLRLVESKRIADPQWADVRVMTIHQAKGLQFDVVVLPELEAKLVGQPDRVVTGRPRPTEPVNIVCRHAKEQVRQFFPPELARLFEEDTRLEVHESLCVLYVALTRAVHALHMLVLPAKANERSMPKTFAGLVRAALAADKKAEPGQTLYEHGDRQWFKQLAAEKSPPVKTAVQPVPTTIRLAPPLAERDRGLERTSPSALEGGSQVAVAHILRGGSEKSLGIGTLVHGWLEHVEWLDDGLPEDDVLLKIADRLGGELGDVAGEAKPFLKNLKQQLGKSAVAAVLSRGYYASPQNLGLAVPQRKTAPKKTWPGPIELRVFNERKFAIRRAGQILSGSIDRLVVIRCGGQIVAADIVDYKTDDLSPGDRAALKARAEYYEPQLAAYRSAAAELLRIDGAQIAARLVFLQPGIVWPLA